MQIDSTKACMFPATSMPDRNWWQELWPKPKETMQSLGVREHMTVLDLCCGDGYFTVPLAELVEKVYGLELDCHFLIEATRLANDQGVSNCQWVQGDAMKTTSLVPENVDCVLMANTFHGIPEKTELVNQIYSLLKSQGMFVVINWHKRDREETTVLGLPRGPKTEMRMSPLELNDIVVPSGFILEKSFDVSAYHYASVYVKL